MAAISGKAARIKITSATATSSTNNAATLAPGGLVLTINSTAKRHWDPSNSTALVVYAGSTVAPSSGYDVRWPVGQVVFGAARSTSVTYTIDVESFTSSYVRGGRDWSLDVTVDPLDVTTFSTDGTNTKWKSHKPGLSEASVSISRLSQSSSTATTFFDRIVADTKVIVDLVADLSAGHRYLGYGLITGDGFSDQIDGLAEESVDITIDGAIYYSTL